MTSTPAFFPAALLAQVRERFHHVDHCPVTGQPRIFLESGGGSLKLKAAIAASAEVSALPDQGPRSNSAITGRGLRLDSRITRCT